MNTEQPDLEAIFTKAIGITDEEERASYLEGACEGNPRLLTELKKMVEAHFAAASFLDQPAPELDATIDADSGLHQEGQAIGLYKLREELGSGGFGVVWAAEQTKPISRKVALKIIKPGMDTRDVIARFEAERQALALMDHPNIARVLDAGTTDQGRPYFVMELIRGVPITRYCDEAKLTVKERLALFAQVCKAIQHAHQKGIIHRDIKPSNVLVTLHDGEPVPKVIDFGIAKALNQRLTDKTIYTRVHQAIGTLAYMSPEQAELSGLDVDTRTDVYGLGVLLYELLTGTTPFDTKRLDQAALHEACRIIREEEPPRASNRISTLGETATIVSKHRGSSPQELAKQVRGDLDWVMLKALEKDRTRRYDSAGAFAADVERFLANEPIEARPPTNAYRIRKFASRNRRAVFGATVVVATLIIGIVTVSWTARTLRRERDQLVATQSELKGTNSKLQATIGQLQTAAYEQAMMGALLGNTSSTEDALEVARTAGVPEKNLDVIQAMIAVHNGEFEEASRLAESVLKSNDNHVAARSVLALSQLWQAYTDVYVTEAEQLSRIEPEGELDHLLMAYALQLNNSEHANRLLDDAGSIQHSPVGLLIRGIDLAQRAEDMRDPKLAEEALFLYRYVPDSPGVMGWRAAALSHLIALRKDAGELDESLISRGKEVADLLKQMEANPFLDYCQWRLLRAIGQKDAASSAIARSGKQGYFAWCFAADCLTRYDSAEHALEEFNRVTRNVEDKYVTLARAFLLHASPGGQQRVGSSVNEMTHDKDLITRKTSLLAFCMAGDMSEVRRLAAQMPIQVQPDRFAASACVAYLADPSLDEDWLLANSTNGYAATNAHFTIAMTRMAKRDRVGALEHFKLCSERIIPGNIAWEMGNAFYQRMNANPDWPHWIAEESAE